MSEKPYDTVSIPVLSQGWGGLLILTGQRRTGNGQSRQRKSEQGDCHGLRRKLVVCAVCEREKSLESIVHPEERIAGYPNTDVLNIVPEVRVAGVRDKGSKSLLTASRTAGST
jgi:hypothetical protein